jgi:hypothetical protein
MDGSVYSPVSGGVPSLTPKQAGRYFEFFRAGTHREALLLGDLVEQQVHYVKSEGHKVLCKARGGFCDLCEKAGAGDDVGVQQTEFYGPSFVRAWKEREFHQRVAVFSEAAAEELMNLIDRDHEGVARGCRLDVSRHTRGTSSRFVIRIMDGLPRGFPSLLPAAFDLLPWIRARFGKRQTPDRPLVILPSFKCEVVNDARSGRPKPLDLSAEDYKPGPEELEKVRAKLAAARAMFAGRPVDLAPPAPNDNPPPVPAAPAVPEPTPEPEPVPVPAAARKPKGKSVFLADPDELARRKAAKEKARESLAADEAVEFGRVGDFLVAGIVGRVHANGTTENGGAK